MARAARLSRLLGGRTLPPRAVVLGAFASTSVINYAFSLIMGHLLAPGDFGLLAFAQTVLLIGGLVVNSGFAWSLTKALVGVAAAERGRLARGALLANLVLAGTLSAGLIALFALGPLRGGLESWAVVALVAAALPFMAILAITRASAQGAEAFGIVALCQVIEVTCKALGGVVLLKLGWGATGAVGGFVVGAALAAALGAWLLRRRLGIALWGAWQRPALRVAGTMFGALLGLALLLNLDILALKLLSGDRAITGHYQAGIVLANLPYYLASALIPVVFTQVARQAQLSATPKAVGEALRFVLVLALPLEAALILAPQAVQQVMGYTPGAAVVRLLAVANSALMVIALLSAVFQAAGRPRTPARTLLAVVTAEVAVQRWAVPRWAALGAAATFCAACLAALVALATAYIAAVGWRNLHIRWAWLAKYAVTLGAACLAGALVLGATGSVIAAALAGAPIYLAGVWLGALLRLPAALQPRWPHRPRPATSE